MQIDHIIETLRKNRLSVEQTKSAWSEFYAVATRKGQEFDCTIDHAMLKDFIAFMNRTCAVTSSRMIEPHYENVSHVEVFGLFLSQSEELTLVSFIMCDEGRIEAHMMQTETMNLGVIISYFSL